MGSWFEPSDARSAFALVTEGPASNEDTMSVESTGPTRRLEAFLWGLGTPQSIFQAGSAAPTARLPDWSACLDSSASAGTSLGLVADLPAGADSSMGLEPLANSNFLLRSIGFINSRRSSSIIALDQAGTVRAWPSDGPGGLHWIKSEGGPRRPFPQTGDEEA
ncbi:hypothetical protein H696_00791 [Fonticula alba]|uniref:Uncharacterized protein n=1 Tax=Fonticula alba TaxID=691883 RepID=A0A058ZFT3_FONAL|nr:hypothetical protein H696_00791 [Fonticula alba]KCV73250.1 hypothetical protein H696_00791 [Fonticula alba]|eukprot:XP_009492951.1 hypothetical protein H696_00791 [Fonticula alba]